MHLITALKTRRVWPAVFVCLPLVGIIWSSPSCAVADEVDDVLRKRAKNQDRVQRFSADFLVETKQPSSVKNPKTLKMRFRMKMEKLPPQVRKNSNNPWLMETEVLEPLAMKLKVKGDQAWFLDQHGAWVELPMTPEIREQFFGMSERFMGADPAKQRKEFDIKVLRHNNPIFGPKTKTLEFKPKGKAKMFRRMEEDVNADGFPLVTRLFDGKGKKTVEIKVKKHRKIDRVPVMEVMEAVSWTPAGEVVSRTVCSNIELSCRE